MRCLIFCLLTHLAFPAFSQCEISHKLAADGTMYYSIQPVTFYFTNQKALKGGLVTDKENFYLALQPVPFPKKPAGLKLKGDLELKLANNKDYILRHFDARYMDQDSTMQLLYSINKKDLNDFLNFEAVQVKINMGLEGIRSYVFKLHKKALQEQLACFLKKKKEKK